MAKHIDPAVKQAALTDIKNGMRVSEAAKLHGTTDTTIYGWLKQQADNTGTSALEVAKLRRENQELKEIIGWFTFKEKRGEKIQEGRARMTETKNKTALAKKLGVSRQSLCYRPKKPKEDGELKMPPAIYRARHDNKTTAFVAA